MKVPNGKRVVYQKREYLAGAELPDDVARKLGLLKEEPVRLETTKPKKKDKTFEFAGTDRRGFGSNA
jgi:hypothetical protein